jgi:hypothetical protein
MGKSNKKLNELLICDFKRKTHSHEVCCSSRPFVFCGLPYRQPDELIWERRNGKYKLEISADERYGLPYGQDRIIPIFLVTKALKQKTREITWKTAGEVLDMFGLARDGRNYRRLIDRFKRIFHSTIYYGSEDDHHLVINGFRFMDELQLWYDWKNYDNCSLPGFENRVVLSEPFWKEICKHPIPLNLEAVSALIDSPGALDLYCFLSWRENHLKKKTKIPLEGGAGLFAQLGMKKTQWPSQKKKQLDKWLKKISVLWSDLKVKRTDKHLVIWSRKKDNPGACRPKLV